MIEVLRKVKKARERFGYSQENMAHELKVSQAAYAKLEKNKTKLTVKRLFEIAEILEMDVYELLEVEPKEGLHERINALIDRLERLLSRLPPRIMGRKIWNGFSVGLIN